MSEVPRDTERQPSPFLPQAMKKQLEVILQANEIGWMDYQDPLYQYAAQMHEEVFGEGKQPEPEEIVDSATHLLTEVWFRVVTDRDFPERGPVPDTSLSLRDILNPSWPGDSDWLPEELKLRLG